MRRSFLWSLNNVEFAEARPDELLREVLQAAYLLGPPDSKEEQLSNAVLQAVLHPVQEQPQLFSSSENWSSFSLGVWQAVEKWVFPSS